MPQNSPFSELILQLQERLATQVPAIKYIDEEKGQLESYDTKGRPMVSFPCILVDFNVLQINDMSDNIQEVQMDVIMRLGFPPYSSAASLMPQEVKENALKYFDIEYEIYKALQGWAPTGFSSLLRRSPRTETGREDAIRVRELHFETEFVDTSAQPARTTIAAPDVELDVNTAD